MRALTRKLLRELWGMRAQALAIAVVIASGVATLVMFLSALAALTGTRDAFYRDYRFADVFASVERAPRGLADELAAIPGVQQAVTRVVVEASLELPGFDNPATARIVSLPEGRNAALNRLYLTEGRLPEPGREREAVVSDAFAEAHGLHAGARLAVVVRGGYETLEVVGVATSPEFVYQIRPGEIMPDYERYAILWMSRPALAAAYDMEGAFNDVLLRLARGARPEAVIEAADRLLDPWGGRGAYGRAAQLSHNMLAEELGQLANLAVLIPTIFFGVAAFLLNLVLTRLIATQRQAIGTLKAFGYSRAAIAAHYAALVLLIAALGVVLGVAVGYGLGALISEVYAAFYRFPFLDYRLPGRVVAVAGGITAAVALAATLGAVLRAARLPPAQAMRPAAPPSYRATLVERLGLQRWLGQPTRIILRSLERRPLRTLLSVTGLACAVGILLIGPYQRSAIDTLIGVQFNLIQRDSVSVSFYEPTSRAALHELARLPGVDAAEPYRRVAAELIAGHRRHRLAVLGLAPGTSLRRLLDTGLREVAVPEQGVLLTAYLAERLGVAPGDPLEIRLLEGRRETVRVPVSGVIAEYLGVSAYMALETLNRLAGEGDAISGAWLAVADGRREAVLAELDRRPRVAGATESGAAMASFRDNIAESQRVTALMTTVLAAAIAFGVVYNNARIALSERSRELASLRVLGFTRGEIAYILLGEQALLIAAALPPGMLVGHALFAVIVRAAESELYRIPLIVSPAGMALAAAVVAGVGAVSAYVVRRRLDRLDLVEALKSRE